MAADETKPGKSDSGLGQLAKAESALQLAFAIPGACLIGWLIGTGLDQHFHRTWISIAGLLFGAVAGFVQMITFALRMMRKGDG